jgi:hypothetical protein
MYSFRHRPIESQRNFWVVCALTNPQRYRSRYELYREFEAHVLASGANLLTVEGVLGDRPSEIDGPHVHRVQLFDELWSKENLINIGIQRLPTNWQYVAWIDADVQFTRRDWIEEATHVLQHYKVAQMFSHAIDLGPHGEHSQTIDGFVWSWINNKPRPYSEQAKNLYLHPIWHPGYAWCARREAIDALGGLMDHAILGSADHHMAHALIGDVHEYWRGTDGRPFSSPGYVRHLDAWETRAETHIRRNVGYVPGTIVHGWHGSKVHRRYGSRWEILKRYAYDPDQDIKRDWQGVIRFTDRGERMRNDFREYFRSRNEDSVDV